MNDEDIFKDVKKVAQVNINSEVTQNIHLPSEKPPLPSNIPLPKGFIGRVDELNQLQTAKDSGKTAFVLHGAGGVGKTDLALEFIRRNKADYQADIRVDMQGLSDKPLLPNDGKLEVIRAFEPKVPADLSDTDINNLYESFLNQHRTILFFDNAKDRAQVESLNDASALVVITSRETFNVSGGFGKEIEQMSPADARQLLYSMTDETRFDGQADALADLAGYLPMALLPLAALLVSDITLDAKDLVQRYADRQERLRLADPNRANLSVEASFDLSYDTLRDELKTFWRKLAVFPADFDLEAMQAVWEVESGTTIRAELVNKHLLEFDTKTKRSKLHDLASDYTNEKLINDELFETKKFHARHYVSVLQQAQSIRDTETKTCFLEALNLIDLEWNSIITAQKWSASSFQNDTEIAELCLSFTGAFTYIDLRISPKTHIEWLNSALGACRKTCNRLGEVVSLGDLGNAYDRLGEYQKAIEYYEQAVAISREIGDRLGEGKSLGSLGLPYDSLGDYRKAIEYQEQSLVISREIGNRSGEGKSLGNLGLAYLGLGEYREAIKYQEQSLVISREIGYRSGEGKSLGNLGSAYLGLGEKEKARNYHLQSISILEAIESPVAEIYRQNLELLENNG